MRRLAPSALVLAVLALGALAPACGSEGTTPDCTNNVTADGVLEPGKEGCQQFAPCIVNGEATDPRACCPETPAIPCEQVICLFGYGARVEPGDNMGPSTAECFGETPGNGAGGNGGNGG